MFVVVVPPPALRSLFHQNEKKNINTHQSKFFQCLVIVRTQRTICSIIQVSYRISIQSNQFTRGLQYFNKLVILNWSLTGYGSDRCTVTMSHRSFFRSSSLPRPLKLYVIPFNDLIFFFFNYFIF